MYRSVKIDSKAGITHTRSPLTITYDHSRPRKKWEVASENGNRSVIATVFWYGRLKSRGLVRRPQTATMRRFIFFVGGEAIVIGRNYFDQSLY